MAMPPSAAFNPQQNMQQPQPGGMSSPGQGGTSSATGPTQGMPQPGQGGPEMQMPKPPSFGGDKDKVEFSSKAKMNEEENEKLKEKPPEFAGKKPSFSGAAFHSN